MIDLPKIALKYEGAIKDFDFKNVFFDFDAPTIQLKSP